MHRLLTPIYLFVLIACNLAACDRKTSPDETPDGSGDTATERDSAVWEEEEIDTEELPPDVPTVEIIISPEDRERLEGAPFYGDDVSGTFIDGEGKTYSGVDLNFRGAYKLNDLIESDPLERRNWKVKFPKDDMYRDRREWNFNFEPHLRQKLAYDLLKFAGVKVPNADHVVLLVNGEPQGLYLRYEDPDSKDWLFDKFGNADGDLYKGATDMPASPDEDAPDMKYFADTTYLGDRDEDYRYHYRKYTNHKDPATAEDFGVIRGFLDGVNHTPDAEFPEWIDANFDVDAFLSYLAVSNFISNWDSLPQRPKNFWLFENRRTEKMVFIPWDLDLTFENWVNDYNQMGPEAPLLFCLGSMDYRPIHAAEGEERPLVFRLFAEPAVEEAYLARYRDLSETLLTADYLDDRIDALAELVSPHLTDAVSSEGWRGTVTEREEFESALDEMREFVSARTAFVARALDAR